MTMTTFQLLLALPRIFFNSHSATEVEVQVLQTLMDRELTGKYMLAIFATWLLYITVVDLSNAK